jgi:acyl-CoA thioesterase-2
MRSTDARSYWMGGEPKEPVSQTWFRAKAPIGADPHMHQVIMAYASDMNLLSTAMRPHAVHWQTPGFQSASLDHAMWFHKPTDFNEWHLYAQDSPSASGGRGLVRGSIYDQSGVLVASCIQEGLMRMRKD